MHKGNYADVANAKWQAGAANSGWSDKQQANLKELNTMMESGTVVSEDMNKASEAQLGTFAMSGDAVATLIPQIDNMVVSQKGLNATTGDYTNMSNLVGKVMSGNVGALSKYGVSMSDAQQKTLQTGDEMQRATMLAQVLGQNFGGTVAKTSETAAGKMAMFKNGVDQLKESFGGLLQGQVDPKEFTDQLQGTIEAGIDVISTMLPNIAKALPAVIQAIAQAIPTVIPPLVNALISILNVLIKSIPTLIPALINGFIQLFLAIVTAVPQIVNAITPMIPLIINELVKILPTTIQSLVTGFVLLFGAIVSNMPVIISALVNSMPDVISALVKALVAAFPALVKAYASEIGGIVNIFKGLGNSIWGAIQDIPGVFGRIWNAVVAGVGDLPGQIARALGNLGSTIWNGIKGGLGSVIRDVPVVGGAVAKALGLASGGYVQGPGSATSDSIPAQLSDGEFVMRAQSVSMIGKANLEFMNSNGQVPSSSQQAGGTMIFNTTTNNNADPLALSQQIASKVRWATA